MNNKLLIGFLVVATTINFYSAKSIYQVASQGKQNSDNLTQHLNEVSSLYVQEIQKNYNISLDDATNCYGEDSFVEIQEQSESENIDYKIKAYNPEDII